jgi:hypothetical protein
MNNLSSQALFQYAKVVEVPQLQSPIGYQRALDVASLYTLDDFKTMQYVSPTQNDNDGVGQGDVSSKFGFDQKLYCLQQTLNVQIGNNRNHGCIVTIYSLIAKGNHSVNPLDAWKDANYVDNQDTRAGFASGDYSRWRDSPTMHRYFKTRWTVLKKEKFFLNVGAIHDYYAVMRHPQGISEMMFNSDVGHTGGLTSLNGIDSHQYLGGKSYSMMVVLEGVNGESTAGSQDTITSAEISFITRRTYKWKLLETTAPHFYSTGALPIPAAVETHGINDEVEVA